VADTLVLCYHALSDRWPADLSVTPAAFAQQVEHLAARGYRGVTFSEAVHGTSRGRRVAMTFDDAFASVLLAKPVLDEFGWPATVYAVTDFAGSGAPLRWSGIDQWPGTEHEPELDGLSWPELGGLADAGWEVGSHTVSHPHLTRLDDADLAYELEASREAVEAALDRPCETIAYPYGECDERVVRAAGRAGYAAAAALPPQWTTEHPLEWPRAGIYFPDDLRRFRLKTAPSVRRLRRTLKR
jgi:peptidoglycan/xylan/chitin deacetylase (PgdA/CDA1 family)